MKKRNMPEIFPESSNRRNNPSFGMVRYGTFHWSLCINRFILGKRMKSRNKFFIILFVLFTLVYFWSTYCRNSYLLAKARLITVSSAFRSYQVDNEKFPSFDSINKKSMSDYLAAIPKDPWTGINKIVKSYDGTGGWVYDADNCMLKINSVKWWNPYTWRHQLAIKLDEFPKNKQ